MSRVELKDNKVDNLISYVDNFSTELNSYDDLEPLLDRVGNARYVLMGEASHGTHEYYTWRTKISKRLIHEKGFNFIAVEGDWPDCYAMNRYVKNYDKSEKNASELLYRFGRWPAWMWANWEVVALLEWMKNYNSRRQKKVGFYGLDVYSLWESMQVIIDYLEINYPEAAALAKDAYRCFEPYGENVENYAIQSRLVPESCEQEVIKLLTDIRGKIKSFDADPEEKLNAEQNALVMVNAEKYYRAMVRSGPESWNIRDYHMADTLDHLKTYYGKNSKCIIWAHNTHIGDARATDMTKAGMKNLGQIVRERYGENNTVLIGFGSYQGNVIAGEQWGSPMEVMDVPIAKQNSWEDVFHKSGTRNRMLITNELEDKEEMYRMREHRAIGVVYNPSHERFGNYVPTVLPDRYDAFIYLDETNALHPLEETPGETLHTPDTYPWGI